MPSCGGEPAKVSLLDTVGLLVAPARGEVGGRGEKVMEAEEGMGCWTEELVVLVESRRMCEGRRCIGAAASVEVDPNEVGRPGPFIDDACAILFAPPSLAVLNSVVGLVLALD